MTTRCGKSWEYYAEPFPIYTVARGFVSEVRCTLAEWCGGVCERCGGTWETQETGRQSCEHCQVAGYPRGIGPAVVRSHPVTSVRLAGVDPVEIAGTADAWEWPASVVSTFPEVIRGFFYPRWYSTEEKARGYLSSTFIAWAKSLVLNNGQFAKMNAELLRHHHLTPVPF
jgi:hypothetical protein